MCGCMVCVVWVYAVCGCMVCVCGCMVCVCVYVGVWCVCVWVYGVCVCVGVWCVCVVWAYLEREQNDIDDKSENKLAAVETVIVAS